MAQMVEASGMSKGAFYHYFKNKEDIYDSVINSYFLKYIDEINWQELEGLSLQETKAAMAAFYKNFVKQIGELTDKGTSRYFSLFFEAYHQVPVFKEQIRGFYSRLVRIIEDKMVKELFYNEQKAHSEAIHIIAHFEGLLFWSAVFPEKDTSFSYD
ncbi:hypothetical protein GCM10009122_01350 [Fulvivirga kasyanovii]